MVAAEWGGGADFDGYRTLRDKLAQYVAFRQASCLNLILDDIGVKVTLISAGKYKVEGNSLGPLEDEARASMQAPYKCQRGEN